MNEVIRGIPFLASGLDDVEYGEFPATTRCCSPWQIGRNALQPVAEPDEFAVARRLGSGCLRPDDPNESVPTDGTIGPYPVVAADIRWGEKAQPIR